MTIASRAAIAALVVLAVANPGMADPRPVHPYRVQTGQRVRLWTPPQHGGFQATSATVTAVDSTGLTVVIKDRTELIAFTGLARMDVRRGRRYLRRGAVVGLVVGAVAGVLGDGSDHGGGDLARPLDPGGSGLDPAAAGGRPRGHARLVHGLVLRADSSF
jgi:hypothetical protein